MNLSTSTMITVFVIVLVVLLWYSHASISNKVHCVFRSATGEKVEKLRPVKSRFVTFEGRRYDILVARRTLLKWTRGIFAIFPTKIYSYDFTFLSRYPLNPASVKATWDSPENRKKLDQEESFGSFLRHAPSLTGKKQSGLMQWLPIIAIAVAVIVGFMVYQQGQHISVMQQQIENLARLK